MFERATSPDQSPQGLFNKIRIEEGQIAIERVVPPAPYSGGTTSESVQTLADGNHIVHREDSWPGSRPRER